MNKNDFSLFSVITSDPTTPEKLDALLEFFSKKYQNSLLIDNLASGPLDIFKPWNIELINSFLTEKKFGWQAIIMRGMETVAFRNDQDGRIIKYAQFSASDQILLNVLLWQMDRLRNVSSASAFTFFSFILKLENQLLLNTQENALILLTKPDARVHPTNVKREIVDFIRETLVGSMKLQVIMTSCNPTTPACVERENLFKM
jgi:hypothetical protein